MAKAILICGKICGGKSTYAARLRIEKRNTVQPDAYFADEGLAAKCLACFRHSETADVWVTE